MREDPHSCADLAQARTSSVELDLLVDFTTRTLVGEAVLRFAAAAQGPLDLDTRDLAIEGVAALSGTPIAHTLHAPEPILGARLSLRLPAPCRGVRIRYSTSPEATALQWLAPAACARRPPRGPASRCACPRPAGESASDTPPRPRRPRCSGSRRPRRPASSLPFSSARATPIPPAPRAAAVRRRDSRSIGSSCRSRSRPT